MAMNTGMDKYRSMMKRMENMDPSTVVREGENMNVMGNMGGNPLTDREIVFNFMKNLDPRSVVREGEMERPMKTGGPADFMTDLAENVSKGNPLTDETRNEIQELEKQIKEMQGPSPLQRRQMAQDMLSNLSMSDKEAIEALTSMGVSLEDAVEAITKPESDMAEIFGTGTALGALPMSRPADSSVTREGEMGADRTQDMEMQKFNMGT